MTARRTKAYRKVELAEHTTIGAPLQMPAVHYKVRGPKHGLKIAVIPDAQVKPGVPIDHLAAAGRYIAAKRPDVIVCLGDFADMGSLSSYDQAGSLGAEGKRYRADIDAAHRAMDVFMTPIVKERGYHPRMFLTMGNHEDRITRTIEQDPRHFEGLISLDDLAYADYGWQVIPFLQPIAIEDVAFCHYFPMGRMGRPATSPQVMLTKLHMSAIAGHQQGREIAYGKRADGRPLTAIISGSFYQHDEMYMPPFTNLHWRGMHMLHEVQDGAFDNMDLSVGYLLRRFGGK